MSRDRKLRTKIEKNKDHRYLDHSVQKCFDRPMQMNGQMDEWMERMIRGEKMK